MIDEKSAFVHLEPFLFENNFDGNIKAKMVLPNLCIIGDKVLNYLRYIAYSLGGKQCSVKLFFLLFSGLYTQSSTSLGKHPSVSFLASPKWFSSTSSFILYECRVTWGMATQLSLPLLLKWCCYCLCYWKRTQKHLANVWYTQIGQCFDGLYVIAV